MVRVGLGHRLGERVGGLAEQRGVEPEVGIGALVVVALPVLVALVRVVQVDHVGGIHHVVGAVVADRLVDGRLQALLVEHDARGRDLRRLARRQLHVVGLDPGCGQVGDLRVVAHDAFGDVLQRIEGRHHLGLSAAASRGAPRDRSCGQRECDGGAGDP